MKTGPLLLAVVIVLVRSASHADAPRCNRPNFLFIACDDLKPLLGCYGAPVVQTPEVDRLAKSGMVFLNNHCQQAVCGPSRASLLTGLRPDTTKVWDLETRMRDVLPNVLTLPQYLKDQGYHTLAMGKIFDGRCCDGLGKQDAASWSGPHIGTGSGLYAEPGKANARVKSNDKSGKTRPSTENVVVQDDAYQDGRISRRAIDELGNCASHNEPFFLAVGFLKPHLPFTAPRKYWDIYQRRDFSLPGYQRLPEGAPPISFQDSEELRNGYTDVPKQGPLPSEMQLELIRGYHASVSFVDAQIGKVLAALDEYMLTGNTVVVLCGDHGFHLGDHGMFGKHSVFEQATRAPLIIRVPGLATGLRTTSPTEFIDIFPTLCDLAGLVPPEGLPGTSLLPLLQGKASAVKTLAVSQYPRKAEDKDVMGYSYRSERHRYTKWIQKDFRRSESGGKIIARELYDYQSDSEEAVNIVDRAESAGTVAWFEAEIAKLKQ